MTRINARINVAPPPQPGLQQRNEYSITISILRIPGGVGEHVAVEPGAEITFSRLEWSLVFGSGMWEALRGPGGWRAWTKATEHRSEQVTEKSHMLAIAGLFARRDDDGLFRQDWRDEVNEAIRGLAFLSKQARLWREANPEIAVGPDWFYQHFVAPGYAAGPVCERPPFMARGLENAVEETHVKTMVDLAKQGEEATFRELAGCLGVATDKLDELWEGTVKRVKRGDFA